MHAKRIGHLEHIGMAKNTSPMSKNTTPMSMAATARDKLQASARELMRNLEEVISNNGHGSNKGAIESAEGESSETVKDGATSFENAFRAIFASCTTGVDMVLKSSDSKDFTDTPSRISLGTPSKSSSYDHHESPSPQPRVQNNVQSTQQKSRIPPGRQAHQQQRQPPPLATPQQADYGEHIYAQLFFDDQLEASKKVPGTEEELVPGQKYVKSPTTQIPKPFPVSSPGRDKPAITMARFHQHPQPAPVSPFFSSDVLNIPKNLTFDDSISAISAQTLEAMVAQHEKLASRRSRSGESSLFPRTVSSAGGNVLDRIESCETSEPVAITVTPSNPKKPGPVNSETLPAPVSPTGMPRPRSNQTWGSRLSRFSRKSNQGAGKNWAANSGNNDDSVAMNSRTGGSIMGHTKASRHSRSTRTTETTDTSNGSFYNMWQNNEAKYWEEEVHHEENKDNAEKSSRTHGPAKTSSTDAATKLAGTRGKQEKGMGKRRKSRELAGEGKSHSERTNSVTGSSAYSTWSSNFDGSRHPHETFHFEASDFFLSAKSRNERAATESAEVSPVRVGNSRQVTEFSFEAEFSSGANGAVIHSHPDRISQILVLPEDTEMAEI